MTGFVGLLGVSPKGDTLMPFCHLLVTPKIFLITKKQTKKDRIIDAILIKKTLLVELLFSRSHL